MFGLDTVYVKLIGGIAAVLALAFLVHLEKYWHGQASDARAEIAAVCGAATEASGNVKLDCKRDLAVQVRRLGESLKATETALARQNAAVDALAATSAEQQRNAAQALQQARQGAKEAADVSAGLRASSRSPDRAAKPCEPSAALKEAWK